VRLKLDEKITVVAKDPLVELGHDVDTVADEGLAGRPDPDVLAAAIADERALVTFDLGIGDPRVYPPGDHQGIILLRLRDQQPDNVVSVLRQETQSCGRTE
jgi:predicted nuclease of predicted toxin-antitoxin system